MNDKIMQQCGFGREVREVREGICPNCQKPVDENAFKDAVSLAEFKISGLCQHCQDEVFEDEG